MVRACHDNKVDVSNDTLIAVVDVLQNNIVALDRFDPGVTLEDDAPFLKSLYCWGPTSNGYVGCNAVRSSYQIDLGMNSATLAAL